MDKKVNRREALKGLASAGATAVAMSAGACMRTSAATFHSTPEKVKPSMPKENPASAIQSISPLGFQCQRTQFGGWPWKVTDPVHGPTGARFARTIDGRTERPA